MPSAPSSERGVSTISSTPTEHSAQPSARSMRPSSSVSAATSARDVTFGSVTTMPSMGAPPLALASVVRKPSRVRAERPAVSPERAFTLSPMPLGSFASWRARAIAVAASTTARSSSASERGPKPSSKSTR